MESNKIEKAKRKAQFYALLNWHEKTPEEALNMIKTMSYEELDEKAKVYADGSIKSAIQGIKKYQDVLQNGTGNGKYDAIIKILAEIHDNWVSGSAKKYDRGSQEKSDRLIFQHLPLELIGIEESVKDLMFLAPFLKDMGIDVGEMVKNPKTGKYEWAPSKGIIDAFNRSVENYKDKNEIANLNDIKENVKNNINTYKPLEGDGLSAERRGYMKGKIDVIANSIVEKNRYEFETYNDISMKQVIDGIKFVIETPDKRQKNIQEGLHDLGCDFSMDFVDNSLLNEYGHTDINGIGAKNYLYAGAKMLCKIREYDNFLNEVRPLLENEGRLSLYEFVRKVTNDPNYTKENIEKKKETRFGGEN